MLHGRCSGLGRRQVRPVAVQVVLPNGDDAHTYSALWVLPVPPQPADLETDHLS